jgi:hypothetical protein
MNFSNDLQVVHLRTYFLITLITVKKCYGCCLPRCIFEYQHDTKLSQQLAFFMWLCRLASKTLGEVLGHISQLRHGPLYAKQAANSEIGVQAP